MQVVHITITLEDSTLTHSLRFLSRPRPSHLSGFHDDLNRQPLHLLSVHCHYDPHLQISLYQALLVLGQLSLRTATRHCCFWPHTD